MARGAFITIEGGEGVGKTTSLAAIETHLRSLRVPDLLMTREPGGTELGEIVRDWILDGAHGELAPEVEALLMFAARADHLTRVIRPALARGIWVVCDRFTDATMAYQGAGRGANRRLLNAVAEGVQKGLVPDLTVLLDAPVEIGMGRIANRAHDHFEREDRAFFERVRSAYLDLAAGEPNRIRVIDASAPQAEVLAAIRDELDAFHDRFVGHRAERSV